MADDLIPPQIRNGGTGSVQVGGAGGRDYRDVQSPENVRTDLPDNGAAARAAALSGLFKEFEGVSSDVYNKVQTHAGELAGAASGATGSPGYKQGLERFTAYGRAFNNAATGAYAVQAEAQADDAATSQRIKANNNPDTFVATYTATRDAVLKNAPADAVPMLTELYNKRLAQGLASIRGDQLVEQKNLQRKTYDEGIQRDTSSVAILQGSENPQDHLEAADQWVKLSAKINGGVTSGLYSTAEAQAMEINAHREVTAQVFQTQVDKELARPDGHTDILLNNFRSAHIANLSNPNEPPILSEAEYQKLMQDATTKIREARLLQEMEKVQGQTAERLKHEAGDDQYTSQFFQGGLTVRGIDNGLRNGDLTAPMARTLYGLVEGNIANGKGNTTLLFKLHNDPGLLDMKPADVLRYVGPGGLNGTQAETLAKEIDTRNNGYENTQQFRQGRDAIGAELKIPPGDHIDSLDPEKAKAYVNAVQEYRHIIDATDPAKRTQSMATAAETAITHIRQREATSQITQFQNDIKAQTSSHGPGSGVPWSKEKMDAYVKDKEAAIARAQAVAKGQ